MESSLHESKSERLTAALDKIDEGLVELEELIADEDALSMLSKAVSYLEDTITLIEKADA